MKKTNNYRNYDDWVADILRQEKNGIDEYIKMAFEEYSQDGDEKALLIALRQAALAKIGFKSLAEKTGLCRENLYRVLSPNGNPTLHTIKLILAALGYKLCLLKSNYRYRHYYNKK